MNEKIFENYPVLIAQEYWALAESWNNGDLENTCRKVRDLFSIVLKLPVLVYVSVITAKEERSDAESNLLFELLKRRMTFGTWHRLGQSISKHPQFRSFSSELACILSDVIDIYNRHQIPNWRNERFTKDGEQLHNPEDLRSDIEAKLSLFRQHFAACDAAYSQLKLLMVSNGETFELAGKDALSKIHDEQAELWIEIGSIQYALWPYFLLQKGQIYVFDSHDIRKDSTLFVNYADGKHLIFEGQQTPHTLFTQLYEQTYKSREPRKSSTESGDSHGSQNDSTALLYAIENKFPYPIARAFYQLRHIHDWTAQIPQLANILGLLLQHIAMIALAEYLSGAFRDEKLNQDLIRAFKEPVTHGAWLKIADRLLKLLRQRDHRMFMPELLEFYFPERGEETLTSMKAMSKELVEMRNFLLKRIPEFSPARREYEHFKRQLLALAQSLKFLADYPLISVEHSQTQGGVKIHTCYRYVGFHDSFACATLQSELDFDRMRPALLNVRTAEVLYMYPLYALKTSEVESPPLLLLRFGVFDSAKQCIRYATIKEKHSDEQAAIKKGEEHHQEGLDFWALLQGRSLLTLRRKAVHCYLETADGWQKRAVGDVIVDRYEILEHLRRGGMADIYKVKDRRDGTLRALKLLPFQFLNDHTILQRFRSEASEARQLIHENITQVLDAGETLADHYLVMELATGWNIAEGQSAIDVSELPRPVPEQTVLSIAKQTCEALEHIHRQPGRVVHRDIKPGNLLLFENGRVKVTDFGIARSREALKLTLTGLPIGTPEYMSPEQAQGERELTPASDLYSLGTVMYELLTGQTPFRRKTALQTMYAIVHDPVPPLRKLNPAVPKALEQIVMTCLQKTPEERFQSAQALYEALQTYHGDKEGRMWEEKNIPINDTDVEQAEIFRKTKETAILVILFLDIVQSTQLREELGEIRFETVLREKKQTFTAIIERDHKGRVIKDLGDGLLAVFAVADFAVQRALEIQETLVSDSLCKVRIGLDMGQVTQELERGIVKDVFGRHVNRAARLEELGSGGHILTSYTVWDNAENWLKHLEQIRWKNHGCYRLKGIPAPQEVYEPYNTRLTEPLEQLSGEKVAFHEEFTHCQLCGRYVQLSETFRCRTCGLENLCTAFCFDAAQRQCIECSAKADRRTKTGNDPDKRARADRLIALENPEASFRIRIWTERGATRSTTRNILVVPKQEFGQYRLGDKVTAYFESSIDAYVYMLNIGPTGDMTPIFPNDYSSDNHVKSGRQYTFPDENAQFDWILQEPAGTEIIKVIAVRVPLGIEQFLDEQLSTARTLNTGVKPRVSDIVSPDQWAEAACTLLVKK